MGILNSYSIESDDIILLKFSDGRSQRANVKDLPTLLSKDDLKKIQGGLKLRADYIEKHLPNWLKIVVLVGLLLPLSTQTSKAAQVIQNYIQHHILHNIQPEAPAPHPVVTETPPALPLTHKTAQILPGHLDAHSKDGQTKKAVDVSDLALPSTKKPISEPENRPDNHPDKNTSQAQKPGLASDKSAAKH